jgi:IMP dehydrogenase
MKEALSFDDVMLVPAYSEVHSRSAIDTTVSFKTNSSSFTFSHPLIPANMKTIVSPRLAIESRSLNGLTLLHRFCPIAEQFEMFDPKVDAEHVGFSLGVQKEDRVNAVELYKNGVRIFCIDIAHGDSKLCLDMVRFVKDHCPEALVIAGNIATGAAARRLWAAGADVVKSSVGGGSICLTRIETGNGVPLFSALQDIAAERVKLRTESVPGLMGIIADGGIRNSGDCVKSLCFADMVMCGNMFAGCEETPGESQVIDGITYKAYHGSSTHKSDHIEGVKALVKSKGKFKTLVKTAMEGIRSGCSYQGVNSILELQDNPEFVRITSAGKQESGAHDVFVL